jgi:hypothetical protein
VGEAADRMALGAIRREMDIEAIAAGFRESFLLFALFFILGCIPLVCLLLWQLVERRRGGRPRARVVRAWPRFDPPLFQ